MHLLRHVAGDVHRRAGAVRRGAEEIEQRGGGRIVARKAERAFAHADIDRLLEAERMLPPADADRAAPADIDDGGLAAFQKALRAGLGDTVDDEPFANRRDAADDHAV